MVIIGEESFNHIGLGYSLISNFNLQIDDDNSW
jgi:hypothetical protein